MCSSAQNIINENDIEVAANEKFMKNAIDSSVNTIAFLSEA